MRWVAGLTCVVCLLAARHAAAQEPASAAAMEQTQDGRRSAAARDDLPDCGQATLEQISTGHLRYTGDVECELPDGAHVFADVIDLFTEDGRTRLVATGTVVFTGPEGHISASRLEYDTGSGTGTFDIASGILSLDEDGGPSLFGDDASDVYFYGERLEKVGPRRYRVTRGAWTTCEQPTPRWQLASGSMVINLEDYVVASNTVLRVKGVPLFYWPFLYYPIQSDDRATGFLMPTYGTSTFRGQTLSNGFFWAINRSHDATFFHDWFTRAGQGAGAEYRYVLNPASSGTFTVYRFGRSETRSGDGDDVTVLPSNTSFELTGEAVHAFPRNIVARARIDYFSDVINQQLLHQNIYEASRRNRLIEAGASGTFGPLSTNALYQRNEVINGVTDTLVYGNTPRATASLAPQRLFGGPVYASVNAEYAYLPYQRTSDGAVAQDDSFGRIDVTPSVRVPLSRLSFLSVNTSAAYRTTYYSRQAGTGTQTAPGSFLRQYASMRTDVVGPVLSRIWDFPESNFAERLKHVVEPTFSVDVTSPMGDFRRTPVLSDLSDFVVGGSTRITYGVTNRLFSRGRTVDGVRGATREFMTVGLQQSYYTRPEASRYDTTYISALGSGGGRALSPVSLNVRLSPSAALDATSRVEYDVNGAGLQVFSVGTTVNAGGSSGTLNYNRQRLDPSLPSSDFVSSSMRTRLLNERVSAAYAISWDLARAYVVSQSVVASYMAQCCGVQGEYQQFNYPSGFGLPVSSDRRLNFSFVLAGIGTFSNFFGAFGGL